MRCNKAIAVMMQTPARLHDGAMRSPTVTVRRKLPLPQKGLKLPSISNSSQRRLSRSTQKANTMQTFLQGILDRGQILHSQAVHDYSLLGILGQVGNRQIPGYLARSGCSPFLETGTSCSAELTSKYFTLPMRY